MSRKGRSSRAGLVVGSVGDGHILSRAPQVLGKRVKWTFILNWKKGCERARVLSELHMHPEPCFTLQGSPLEWRLDHQQAGTVELWSVTLYPETELHFFLRDQLESLMCGEG